MSSFISDIAKEAEKLPAEDKIKDMDILSRSVKPRISEAFDITDPDDAPIKKPKASKTIKEATTPRKMITSVHSGDEHSGMIVEELAKNITRLEEQLNKVLELTESNVKKYPFAEGSTATNHKTGQQIVFSRGQWWFLDGEE